MQEIELREIGKLIEDNKELIFATARITLSRENPVKSIKK